MDKELKEELCKQIEEQINIIKDQGINPSNLEMLGELVDIKKDISNMEYWEKKEEVMDMNYRMRPMDYGREDYGREGYGARRRGNNGRYMARGRNRSYRGDDMLEEMMENYGTYMEGGNYAGETDKAFDYMLQSAEDFMQHLMEESENPEQMEKIKRMAKRISEMR